MTQSTLDSFISISKKERMFNADVYSLQPNEQIDFFNLELMVILLMAEYTYKPFFTYDNLVLHHSNKNLSILTLRDENVYLEIYDSSEYYNEAMNRHKTFHYFT